MADFNSDGKRDLATSPIQYPTINAISSNSGVSVLLGKEDGTFQEMAQHTWGGGAKDDLIPANECVITWAATLRRTKSSRPLLAQ